jgi:hypothetical protein
MGAIYNSAADMADEFIQIELVRFDSQVQLIQRHRKTSSFMAGIQGDPPKASIPIHPSVKFFHTF